MTRFLLTSLLLLAAAPAAFGQGTIDRNHVPSNERVDPLERRADVIDGNNIRATVTNWGQGAQRGNRSLEYWFEWPKNTGREYIALTQLWVGAEVTSNVGDSKGETLYIVDVADFRSNPRGEQNSWTFEPIAGYVNPASSDFGIAQSDEPDSWPASWPDKAEDPVDPGWAGSWNGFFGKDIFNADQELFYKLGDDQYDRYAPGNPYGNPAYLPDSTDATRYGLGIVAEVRILAWSQILIDDVVFMIHGVKNDGTEDLKKVGFSIWLADCVGGDCNDDVPFFDLLEDIALMTDLDGIGGPAFGGDPVGVASVAFIETPGNAVDRIDNDGDGTTDSPSCAVGECGSPVIPEGFLAGEDISNGIDDNGNGLIDENQTYVPFGEQVGVGYADFIDNDADGEGNAPTVTQAMIDAAAGDAYNRWPANPNLTNADGSALVHLVGVGPEDLGKPFRDFVDNDDSCVSATANYPYLSEPGSPIVTQAMIDAAASDPYGRYRVPGTDIVLLALDANDIGKCYADGIDNDLDGAIDEGIDEGTDEMIDESRADGIDNDNDWNALQDDTGLDGVNFSGDPGDGDGQPTSGAGTDFPGEKNIDVTDVSESDQIGITNVQIVPSGDIRFNQQSDRTLFRRYMLPGDFDLEKPAAGDNDLVVSSGLFPLKAGQTERISLSVVLGGDLDEVIASRDNSLDAYSEDYQFAQAPVTPTLTAVPGNGRVTLYWDAAAEQSIDRFLEGLGLPARDFEGYRIYRATDPAFLDAKTITDGFGNLLFRKPIAQFDLIDGISGFHPVDVNGVKFYLGDDRQDGVEARNGLTHAWTDSTVTNGITYYYAITAYDFGSVEANIPPTETPIRIRLLADGGVETGPNVAEVTPTAPVGGFDEGGLEELQLVEGFTSSRIGYRIVDPRALKDGHRYRITFEDTLIAGTSVTPDTLRTKSFSLIDVTEGETVIDRSLGFQQQDDGRAIVEFPVLTDDDEPLGFSLLFDSDEFIGLNNAESGWSDPGVYPIDLRPYLAAGFKKGFRNPANYRVEVVGEGEGQSVAFQARRRVTLPARPTNVRVFNTSTGEEVDYAFWDLTGPNADATATTPATFSADPAARETDLILVLEPRVGDPTEEEVVTWQIGLNFAVASGTNPDAGDVATIVTTKPFLATDVFEFVVRGPSADEAAAADALDDVRVVPNPYVATNRFERRNSFTSGRGEREIRFINLPPRATIRIYTVSGKHVRTLELNEGDNAMLTPSQLMTGELAWDLRTKDNLDVAYGLYVYYLEAPGVGSKSGTFALIK